MGLIATLVLDIAASWIRMFTALFLSIVFSIYVGITAATNHKKERIILPLLDIFQTIPILGFFPVVIYFVVLVLPGFIGINAAVVFLIFTSMVWNISFGVYEAIKSIPSEIIELARLNHFSESQLYTKIYIPAALPRIAYQSVISWSVGLFYLVTSEIFSTGTANFQVTYGIGVAISKLAASGSGLDYAIALAMFVIAVILTRVMFLQPLSIFAEKHSFKEETTNKKSAVIDIYTRIYVRAKKTFKPLASLLKSSRIFVARGSKGYEFVGKYFQRYIISPTERFKLSNNVAIGIIGVLAGILIADAAAIGIEQYLPQVIYALAFSFVRIWGTYIVAAIIAVPLGIIVAKSRFFESALSALQVISAIPATILLPVIVVLVINLPLSGEIAAFVVIFLAMIWYVLFSVISGMRTIPEQMFELKKMMHLSNVQTWKNIYIPAILPSFITGSITAIGGGWNALIVAEYFTVNSNGNSVVLTQVGTGLGKLIDLSVSPPAPLQANLLLTIMALAAMTIMVLAINRFFWQRIYNKITSKYKVGI